MTPSIEPISFVKPQKLNHELKLYSEHRLELGINSSSASFTRWVEYILELCDGVDDGQLAWDGATSPFNLGWRIWKGGVHMDKC